MKPLNSGVLRGGLKAPPLSSNRLGSMDNKMWETLTSPDNLLASYTRAARVKRSKPDVAGFEMNLEEQI